MGWSFTWLSSAGTAFNYDYGVSFTPEQKATEGAYNYRSQAKPMSDREGVSVFVRNDEGTLFHTYSAYARGIDLLNAAYNYIDLVPKGRDEEGGSPQLWVRRHDEYDP
jgi:predicted dithiol-disulfide oxidoreductase (DUF899 family)